MLGAVVSEAPVITYLGGGLLGLCVLFTGLLFRQARSQYKDAQQAHVDAEVRAAEALHDLQRSWELRSTAAQARFDASLRHLGERAARAERQERLCTRRVDMLITACQQGGVSVPPEVWTLGLD